MELLGEKGQGNPGVLVTGPSKVPVEKEVEKREGESLFAENVKRVKLSS